jgi:hypothetical protein
VASAIEENAAADRTNMAISALSLCAFVAMTLLYLLG